MNDITLTKHADQRLRQRGRSPADLEAVLRFGTRLDPNSVVLLNKDADREVARLKREIARLERLRGWKVVEDGGCVITTYKPARVRCPQNRRHLSL